MLLYILPAVQLAHQSHVLYFLWKGTIAMQHSLAMEIGTLSKGTHSSCTHSVKQLWWWRLPGQAGEERSSAGVTDVTCQVLDVLMVSQIIIIPLMSSYFKYILWKAETELWENSSNGNDGCATQAFPCSCTFGGSLSALQPVAVKELFKSRPADWKISALVTHHASPDSGPAWCL